MSGRSGLRAAIIAPLNVCATHPPSPAHPPFASSVLDMEQYRQIFCTSRVPGLERDELVTNVGAKHIAVFCNNQCVLPPLPPPSAAR